MTQRIALSCVIAALAALCAFTPGEAQQPAVPEPEPSSAETIRIPFYGAGLTLDPHHCQDGTSFRMISTVYETLYMWVPGEHPQVAPCLAEDWPEVSEDGLTWTIKLREDAKFHNSHVFGDTKTRNVKAQDVVDSLKRLSVFGDDGMYWMADGLIAGLSEYGRNARYNLEYGTTDTAVEGLKAIDDRTVQITLTRPFAPLVNMLAHPSFSIVPGEAMDTWGIKLRNRSVGTGKYRLNAISQDDLYVFKAFDGYWGERAPYKRVVFASRLYWNDFKYSFQDGTFVETPVWAAYWDSVVDGVELTGDLAGVEGTPVELPEHGHYFLSFNMQDETWGALDKDGRALRKAVALAFDREKLMERAGYDTRWSKAQDQLFPHGMEFRDTGSADYANHDLQLAKKTLDGSKYKGGKDPATGRPLVLEFACNRGEFYEQVAATLEDGLDQLGIDLTVRYVDSSRYRDAVLESDEDLFTAGWFLDYPDAQNFLQLFWGERASVDKEYNNIARYGSDEFDELYTQLEDVLPTEANRAKRRDLVSRMARVIEKDQPTIPLVHDGEGLLRADSVNWPKLPRQTFNDIRFLKPAQAEEKEK